LTEEKKSDEKPTREEKKITRRAYLKYAGGAVVVAAIAAGGYEAYQYYGQPATPTPTTPAMTTTAPSTGGQTLTVKIGGTKPLTGSVALFGKDEDYGLTVWADQWVNAQGGIKAGDGNTYKVELIIYNDESKPENVSRFYEKLINEDKVDFLLGPVWGPLGMATVPIAEKYHKLEILGESTFDPAQWHDWKYVMHTQTNGSEYLVSLHDMIVEKIMPQDPDAKNVAVVYTDDAFANVAGTYGLAYMKKQAQLNIVFTEKVSYDSTDFTPVLSRVKAAKPSILLFEAGSKASLVAKNVRELGLDVNMLYCGTGAVYQSFYDGLGKYGEDQVSITQWVVGEKYPVTKGPTEDWFVAQYEKLSNGAPPGYTAGTGFTQGLILQAAMEQCSKPLDSDAMRQTVGGVKFTDFFGDIAFDPVTGWQTGHQMSVLQWQDKKPICVFPDSVQKAPIRYPMPKWSTLK
jgi:branched-chain amino acid transport system substrate-binding protein